MLFSLLNDKDNEQYSSNHVDRRKRLEIPARLRHAAISSQCRTRERDAKDVLEPFENARFIYTELDPVLLYRVENFSCHKFS